MKESRTSQMLILVGKKEKAFFTHWASKLGLNLSDFVRLSVYRNIQLEQNFAVRTKEIIKEELIKKS